MTRSLHVILMYILTQLALIFFLYPGDIIESTTESHWIAILMGFGIYFAFLWIFMKGMSYGQGRDMVRLYLRMGKLPAAILLLPVLYYFIIETALTIRAYSEIMTIVFLSSTPLWAIMLILLLGSTFLAAKGLRTILGTGFLVACFGLPLILFIYIASFQNVDWRYIYPLLSNHFSFLTTPSYYKSFFVYSGSFLFLGFVQPYYKFQIRSLLVTSLCLLPLLLSSVYIPVLTFGEATARTLFFPYIVVLDILQIDWLMFERVAVFFLLSLISMMLLFLALTIWQSVRIASQFLSKTPSTYLLIGIVSGVFVICQSITSWENVQQLFVWNIWVRFYILIVVPVTVFCLGRHALRGASDEKNGSNG